MNQTGIRRNYTKLCGHCGVRPRINNVGSLCDWCWRNVTNRFNCYPHDGRTCHLNCPEVHDELCTQAAAGT
jgi:hypothetical protein